MVCEISQPKRALRKWPLAVPRGAKPEHPPVCLLRLSKPRTSDRFHDTTMARTRGAKSSSPSTRLRIPRDTPVQGSTSEPPQPRVVPPPVEDAPISPPPRRYNTRRSLTMAEPESEPTPSPPPVKKSPPPAKKPQPSQTLTKEQGHSTELCFDIATFDFSPLSSTCDSCDFSIPTWHWTSITHDHKLGPDPIIHFTIDGHHGILGARHIAEALHIPMSQHVQRIFEPGLIPEQHHSYSRASSRHYILRKELPPSMFFIDALLRHNIFPLQHWKLLRVDAIPLLFPRLLCQILEHLGYPAEPQHERRRICREIFTLDKWTSMTAYGGADQGAPAGPKHPEQPEEPVDIPADMRAPAHAAPAAIQHHPGIISAPSMPLLSRQSHHKPPFRERTMPPEEPSTERRGNEPSSPHHPPPTI
ncbi:hypothetical protein AAG906_027317 [Vitis piasezkii]